MAEAKREFSRIKGLRYHTFQQFFDKLTVNLEMLYKDLMNSEMAQSFLILENNEEPYLGGVIFNCIIPGKIFQPISCLSGGEKALTAFAFIFATYFGRLPAFFIMDEIDGPLDNDNIGKLVRFCRNKKSMTQFIFISLKNELFGHSDSLIGVYRKVSFVCLFNYSRFKLTVSFAQKTSRSVVSETLAFDLRSFPDDN